jgi:nitrite reductase (NADH) small subunit
MAEYRIGRITQIPPGEGRNFLVAEQTIAVFRTRDDAVYATQARCPHRGGPLADGLLDGASVICPLHDRAFAFASGDGIGNECSVKIYPAHVDADGSITLSGI